jgi:hypothetical protein
MELCQKGLKSVNVKIMMFIFIVKLGFPVMAIIVGYEAPSTRLHGTLSQILSLHHLSHSGFLAIVIYPL